MMTGIIGFLRNLRAQIEFLGGTTIEEDAMTVDLARQTEVNQVAQGPRFWFTRSKDNSGWKCVVHGNGNDDPTHCVFINDNTQKVEVYEQGDAMWPD